jgi:hypothetical protein
VIDHLDFDIKRALEEAVNRTVKDAKFDRDALFQEFLKAAYQHCSIWESTRPVREDVMKRRLFLSLFLV